SGIISSVVSGRSHTLTVRSTSDNTCTATETVVVDAVPDAPITPTADVDQPTCETTTGTITVTAPLGAEYEYSLDGGAWQSGITFSGVSAGSHTLTVRSTSDNTCTASETVVVDAVPDAPITPTARSEERRVGKEWSRRRE